MWLWSWLFGTRPATAIDASPGGYVEADNRGTRHDSWGLASSYWTARLHSLKKGPFVLYTFDKEADARSALLELPCIHAADTGRLICTEVLIFGAYPAPGGGFEAVLCGDDLTVDLWEQARDAF